MCDNPRIRHHTPIHVVRLMLVSVGTRPFSHSARRAALPTASTCRRVSQAGRQPFGRGAAQQRRMCGYMCVCVSVLCACMPVCAGGLCSSVDLWFKCAPRLLRVVVVPLPASSACVRSLVTAGPNVLARRYFSTGTSVVPLTDQCGRRCCSWALRAKQYHQRCHRRRRRASCVSLSSSSLLFSSSWSSSMRCCATCASPLVLCPPLCAYCAAPASAAALLCSSLLAALFDPFPPFPFRSFPFLLAHLGVVPSCCLLRGEQRHRLPDHPVAVAVRSAKNEGILRSRVRWRQRRR